MDLDFGIPGRKRYVTSKHNPLVLKLKFQFLAWSNSSTSSSNAKTDNQTSGDGWANFDDADFGQPDRSSSPESAKNSEKMETDTFSTPANNTEGQ